MSWTGRQNRQCQRKARSRPVGLTLEFQRGARLGCPSRNTESCASSVQACPQHPFASTRAFVSNDGIAEVTCRAQNSFALIRAFSSIPKTSGALPERRLSAANTLTKITWTPSCQSGSAQCATFCAHIRKVSPAVNDAVQGSELPMPVNQVLLEQGKRQIRDCSASAGLHAEAESGSPAIKYDSGVRRCS